jgi:hypothetical protein
MDWHEFARTAPDFASAGLRLLTQPSGVAIGFLATVDRALHLAPVCPIFCDGAVYLSVGATTPKRRDLDRDGRYVLHAFLARNDEEFRIAGRASIVPAEDDRARVQSAIRFGAFGRDDPIYRLDVASAMWGYWENVGRPGTRPIRRSFPQRAIPTRD